MRRITILFVLLPLVFPAIVSGENLSLLLENWGNKSIGECFSPASPTKCPDAGTVLDALSGTGVSQGAQPVGFVTSLRAACSGVEGCEALLPGLASAGPLWNTTGCSVPMPHATALLLAQSAQQLACSSCLSSITQALEAGGLLDALSSLHHQSLTGPQGDAVCSALLGARVGCCLRPWARWMAGLTRHLCLLPLSAAYLALGGRCSAPPSCNSDWDASMQPLLHQMPHCEATDSGAAGRALWSGASCTPRQHQRVDCPRNMCDLMCGVRGVLASAATPPATSAVVGADDSQTPAGAGDAETATAETKAVAEAQPLPASTDSEGGGGKGSKISGNILAYIIVISVVAAVALAATAFILVYYRAWFKKEPGATAPFKIKGRAGKGADQGAASGLAPPPPAAMHQQSRSVLPPSALRRMASDRTSPASTVYTSAHSSFSSTQPIDPTTSQPASTQPRRPPLPRPGSNQRSGSGSGSMARCAALPAATTAHSMSSALSSSDDNAAFYSAHTSFASAPSPPTSLLSGRSGRMGRAPSSVAAGSDMVSVAVSDASAWYDAQSQTQSGPSSFTGSLEGVSQC